MKAMQLNAWGQPVQVEDIAQPEPGSDEVLVRVRAASINPFDTWVYAGYMQQFFSVPLTMGTDFAGDVVKVGAGIEHVKPGDAVYGLVPMHPGSFAEYVVAKANEVALKPKSIDYVHAAGVPLSSLAGCQSLLTLGEAKASDRILIIGAAGAVGGCAVQLAKELGAYVYAVDVPERGDFVRSLGVDRFIDAKAERFEDVVGTVDLVEDYVGGEYIQRSLTVLPDGGRYVTSLILPTPFEEADRRGIRAAGLATQARTDHLNDMAERIDKGILKVFVECTFPLEQAQEALEYMQKERGVGKVVLTV